MIDMWSVVALHFLVVAVVVLLALVAHQIGRLERTMRFFLRMEVKQMALGQEILEKVRQNRTVIDGFLAWVAEQVAANVIPPEVGAAIKAELDSNRATLEGAFLENVPPVEPPPVP